MRYKLETIKRFTLKFDLSVDFHLKYKFERNAKKCIFFALEILSVEADIRLTRPERLFCWFWKTSEHVL